MNRRRTAACAFALLVLTATSIQPCTADDDSRAADSDPLLKMIDEAIAVSKRRYLTANAHTPWQILHGMLALRGEYQVRDDKTGKLINAADWMASGVYFHGEPWFHKTKHGAAAHPYTKDYIFEGHPNQFLAIMSSAGFPIDFEFKAGKDLVTIRDMIRNSKYETNDEEETTWTLWSLSHYLGAEATWVNKKQEPWSIEKLVDVERRKKLERSACGGSHSLFALASALKQYRKTGKPLRGVWLAADMRVKKYIAVSKAYQNPDGSFSSEYFAKRGFSRDFEKRLSTTGHVLEFLMMALPDDRVNEDWVRNGVYSVCRILIDNQKKPAEPGALYHALDGLILYRARVTGKLPWPAGVPRVVPQRHLEGVVKAISQPKPLTITDAKLLPLPPRKPAVARKPVKRVASRPKQALLPIPPKP